MTCKITGQRRLSEIDGKGLVVPCVYINHIWWGGGLIRGIKIPQQELEPKTRGGGGVIAGPYGNI